MPTSDPKKLAGIFISYRRTDTPDAVGRIYDRLVSEFGKARVFKDVDSIPLGQDFRGHLNDIVGGCAAVLAIIGPRWVDTRNASGQRRLEDPDDFVRIELEAALARSVPVVPVLVGHAPMPGSTELPTSLASMAFRQSIEVRPDPDFHNDATRLVIALRAIIDPDAPRVEPSSGRPQVRRFPGLAILAATATLAALALAIPALKYLRNEAPVETRTDIVTPISERPRDFALSPDGGQIAFVASGDGVSRLWVRSLGTGVARALAGTEGASSPFWSPDSRAIAFFSRGRLRRLDLTGGAVQTLTPSPAGNGGSWGVDGTILYSVGPGATSLMRIPATGGTVVPLTNASTSPDATHRWPQWLPDGRRFLFYDGAAGDSGIYLGSLDGSAAKRIVASDSAGIFLSSGWLLWGREGALVAQRLDLDKAQLMGNPVTVASDIEIDEVTWGAPVSVDAKGQIAYRTGRVGSSTQLTWVDGSGVVKGTLGELDTVPSNPRVSPDGTQVAVDLLKQNNADIWLFSSSRPNRLTFEPSEDERPVWFPDGKRLIYRTRGAGGNHLYQRSASGSGERELLMSSERVIIPTSISPDGRVLLYFEAVGTATNDADLKVLPLTGDRKPSVLWKAPEGQSWGSISPDGQWVVYQSGVASQFEIFVRPFTQAGSTADGESAKAGQWQVSAGGGAVPVWRRDGKEIYYLDPDGAMMAATFSVVAGTPVISPAVKLFQARVLGGGGFGVGAALGRQYDVAPDGRFLINSIVDTETVPPITLIQNWNPDAGK